MAAATALFTQVDVHASEGDTSRMLNLNTSSLYEIKTVLDILPKDGFLPDGAEKPQLAFHAFKEHLAIGVGPVLHLMVVYPDMKCEQTVTLSADICALRYLLDARLLVAFLIDGTVVFINTLVNQHRTRKLLSSCSLGAVVNEYLDEDRLILIVTDPDGTSRIIQLPQFEKLADCDARVFDEKLADAVNGASFLSSTRLPSPFTSFISSSELLSFSSTPGTSYSLSLGSDSFLETCEFMEDDVGYVCARKVGHYSVALSRNGFLHIYDDFTGQNVKNVDLRLDDRFDDQFLSFEFLDAKVDEEALNGLKLLLSVKTQNGKNEVQIRRFSDQKIEYQVKTSAQVAMLPDSAGEENSIILIDPFNQKNPDSIQLRFINEAHPELRFEKLIASGRFDDAESFAKMFSLDIQKVHIKRTYEMINDFGEDDQENKDLMKKILSYCDKMTDDNAVGDICVHAVTIVPTYQCIAEFLSYASKRKITDADTASTLASRRYNLFTFAAISDCENNFNWDAWMSLILNEEAAFDLFEMSWALGEVTAARVFWNRYTKQIQDHLVQFGKLDKLLDNLQGLALDETSLLGEVIEFVQQDFGPFYILLSDDSLELQSKCNTLVQFLTNIAVGLERMDPDAFPENSLFTCGMMERMLENLRLKKTTPAHQRTLYKILGMLGASTATSSLASGELAARTSNLRRMVHLKKAYQCKIAYNQFTGHTVETICFVILDRCRSVQLVPKHLKDLVLPYMKEHGLKKDATLLEYIKTISDRASETSQQNNPWDDLCICFAEAIDNILYRCQAVIKIAKRSSIPWSKRLKNAVNEMFKAKGISADLRRDLQAQCQTEEVLSLMIQYDMNSTFLSRVLNKCELLEMLTRAFLSSPKPLAEKWEQLTRMAQLIEVINHKNMEVEFNVAVAAVISASMAPSIESIKPSLENVFSMIKAEKLKRIAAETLVQRCTAILEGTEAEMIPLRSSAIEACIAASKFLPASETVTNTLDIVGRLSRLQAEYQETVAFSELTNYGKQAAGKRVMAFLNREPAKTMEELVNFGELLLLGKEQVLHLYIEQAHAQQTLGPDVFEKAIFIIADSEDDLNRDAVIAVIRYIRQMFFMFHQYASRQHFHPNDAKGVIDFFKRLSPSMAKFAESSLKLELNFEFDLLCSVQEFLSLFHEAVQCLSELPQESDASFVATVSTKDELSPPTFVFYPAMAGMLFDSVDVIKSLARVGYSVFMKANGDDTLLSINATTQNMDQFWEDVFSSFTSNSYLAVIARNFASKLPCLGHISDDRRLTKRLILDLCQKIVAAEKVNLHLAVSLLRSMPDSEAEAIIKALFDWANGKQSSRAVFYVCLVAQAVAIVTGSLDTSKALYESYRDAWWCRRFAKEGILPTNIKQLDAVHKEFVSKMASPRLFEAYCKEYGRDANAQLLHYAFDLLESSSTQEDEMKFEKILETCRFIFRITTSDPQELSLRALFLVDKLCPYNYQALNMVIGQFHHWAAQSQEKDLIERAKEYRILLKFLCKNERRNDFTLQETRWYLERQKRSVNSAQESMAFGSDTMDFQMESDHDLLNVAERQSLLEKNYPAAARKRFPFHVFLLQTTEEYEQLIGPILVNELDIQNAFLWVDLISQTNFVCSPLSKTALITAAISNKVREVVSQQSELEEEEIQTIRTLLLSTKVSLTIVKRIAKDLNQLPLCLAKIKVLSLLQEVSQNWLQSPGVNTKDKDGISDFVYIIDVVLKKYRCEHVLDEFNVVLVEKSLLEDGAALIQHVLAECIDWNDSRDIKRKMKLAREIAFIHGIPLEKSLNDVVDSWLKGGESVVGYLKPVITAGQFGLNALDAAENIFPPLPYNDVDVVRMAYILHELQSVETCKKVARAMLVESDSASNYLQRLRILCVFIRCLDNDAFKRCFTSSIEDFANQLYSMILSFAFKVTQIDFKIDDYQRNPPQQIVTFLVNPQSGMKQSLETFQLAAATIIDGGVSDMALIERTLKRLMSHKCMPFVEMLLRYVVRLSNVVYPPTLPNNYAAVGDAFWDSLNDEVEGYQIRDLVYFLLSCPVEAGNGFKRMLNNLGHKDLVVASRMIAAANGMAPPASSGIASRSTKDVPKINPEAMNRLGSFMKSYQGGGETMMDADQSIED